MADTAFQKEGLNYKGHPKNYLTVGFNHGAVDPRSPTVSATVQGGFFLMKYSNLRCFILQFVVLAVCVAVAAAQGYGPARGHQQGGYADDYVSTF